MSQQFLRNTWYAAAWEHEIAAADGALGRRICDEPIVIYRTEAGDYVALDDRCCHRAAPLSIGRIEGNCIRCMYHGLLYDPAGKVVEIPGQDRISDNMRIRSYPLAARGGMLWIWMGDPALADEADIHDLPALTDPGFRGFEKEAYLHYEANWLLIVDNLADFTHVAYVHPNTLGGSEEYAVESTEDVAPLDTGVSITRWHYNSGAPPFHRAVIPQAEHNEPLDRCNDIRLHLPGVFLMETRFNRAGAAADAAESRQYRNCQFMTPETWNTTHFFWNYLHNFELDNAAVTSSLQDSLLAGFLEDKVFIEEQQKLLERDKSFTPRSLAGDKALMLFRNRFHQALGSEREAAGDDAPTVTRGLL